MFLRQSQLPHLEVVQRETESDLMPRTVSWGPHQHPCFPPWDRLPWAIV